MVLFKKEQHRFAGDRRAASSVVGVILVVALAIILAAILSGAVYDISENVGDSPPNTQFDFEQTDIEIVDDDGDFITEPAVVIEHENGDTIDLDNLRIRVNGDPAYGVTDGNEGVLYVDDDGDSVIGATGNDPDRSELFVQWDDAKYDNGEFNLESGDEPPTQITAGDETVIAASTTALRDNNVPARSADGEHAFVTEDHHLYTEFNEIEDDLQDNQDWTLEPGDEVELIWSSGDRSSILVTYEIQDPAFDWE